MFLDCIYYLCLMTDFDFIREESILREKELLYELFLIENTYEVRNKMDSVQDQSRDYLIILNCGSSEVYLDMELATFVECVRNGDATENPSASECYFCDYKKDDDFVSFMNGFAVAHKSCENIIRTNFREFIENNSEKITSLKI